MTNFPSLDNLIGEVEHAEAIFDLKTAKTYDDKVVAAAAADFNRVLEKAANAIVKDIGDAHAETYLDAWRPKYPVDTWFGPHPVKFLRHVLATGSIHYDLLPDQMTVH